MAPEKEVADALRRLEEELLLGTVRHDASRLRELLSPDFEEVGASGHVFGRAETIALLRAEGPEEARPTMEDFRAKPLTEDLVQVRYRSRRNSAEGERMAERTSLWRRENGAWVMLFHQGTPLPHTPAGEFRAAPIRAETA